MRRCIKCREYKQDPAFVGYRNVCRICYLYLSPEEKEAMIFHRDAMERKKMRQLEKLVNYKPYEDADKD